MIGTIVYLSLIIAIWGSMLIPLAPLLVTAYIFDKFQKKPRKEGWLISLVYVTDILTNVILGGYKRTTISSELGFLRLSGSRGGTMAADFVDFWFVVVFQEIDHCTVAMEKEDKYFFSPFKALIGAATYLTTYYFITVGFTTVVVDLKTYF